MQATSTMVSIDQYEHLPASVSAVVLWTGVCVFCSLILLSLILYVRASRRARMADASVKRSGELTPGEIILTGTVELMADAPHAVRIEIDQMGEESESSGSWSHTWTEVDRRVRVAPFYIKLRSGQKVRVEPGQEVLLIDDLDGKSQTAQYSRTRSAELTPGERVVAHGRLEWGKDEHVKSDSYRGTPGQVLVLRPIGAQPMMLSSEQLGDRFRRHAGSAIQCLVMTMAAFCLFAALVTPYAISSLDGQVVPATVLQRSFYGDEDDDGDWSVDYEIDFAPANRPEERRTEEVGRADFERVRRGNTVPYLFVPTLDAVSHFGFKPSMHIALGIFAVLTMTVTPILWTVIRRWQQKWYERARVIDSGSGRIAPLK